MYGNKDKNNRKQLYFMKLKTDCLYTLPEIHTCEQDILNAYELNGIPRIKAFYWKEKRKILVPQNSFNCNLSCYVINSIAKTYTNKQHFETTSPFSVHQVHVTLCQGEQEIGKKFQNLYEKVP